MKGQEIIDFIQKNNLEEALLIITATHFYEGDHDCVTTDRDCEIDISESWMSDREDKTINLYIGDIRNL